MKKLSVSFFLRCAVPVYLWSTGRVRSEKEKRGERGEKRDTLSKAIQR